MRFNLIISFFALLLLIQTSVWAQQRNYSTSSKKAIERFEKAITAFDERRDTDGEMFLKKALEADDKFIEAYSVLGDMYSNTNQPEKAIEQYQKALEINAAFFPNNYNSLGVELMKLGRYNEAKESFKKFLGYEIKSAILKRKVQKNMLNAEFAAWATTHPVPFNPQNLGANVNSKYAEYLPALTADGQTLIVTVLAPDDSGAAHPDQRTWHEDFYETKFSNSNWSPRRNVGKPINTAGNEGAQCISPDGQILFFTACEEGPGRYEGDRKGYGSCDIFFAQKVGNTWSKPQNIGQPINSIEWDTQPSISSDGNTLYFVSKRKGGKGGSDIYMSTLTKEGYWGPAINLGDSINTEYDESSAFIHPDNQTLYFTSSGHVGMGGTDIYMSKKNKDGKFGHPVNLGYPINTSTNESSLIVSTDGKTAYYSSKREGGFGMDDIYSFEMPENVRPLPTSYFKGKVYDKVTGTGIEASFELTDLETGKVVAESYSNAGNGEFLICLPTNKNYMMTISKNGYLFYSDNFSMKGISDVSKPFVKDVPLIPIKAGEKVVLKNIFFKTGAFELEAASQSELMTLVNFLTKNATLKIEISGHTDNVGAKDKNQLLSENRAKSVVDFLVSKQIAGSRLTFKGYGDTQPINENDTDEHRANNRRTEFKIIE